MRNLLLLLVLASLAHFTPAQVVISEINYNSEVSFDADDWVEFWNTDPAQTASLTGWYFSDSNPVNRFYFPANTSIPANGRIVVARNMVKFGLKHPSVAALGPFGFGLSGAGDAVKLYNGQNTLISSVAYADSLPWPSGADGQGRTLEVKDPAGDFTNPANWFDGCIGGSPGAAYSPCLASIVFSEINYTSDTLTHDTGDWVELRNISGEAMDLSNWTFKDGIDSVGHTFTLPAGTILAPQANLVLVQDAAKFTALHPAVTNFLGSFGFGLSSKGEWIRAYDATGLIRLSVRYDNNAPWDTTANGDGYTLELKDSTGLMSSGLNWFAGCVSGSPGAHFTPCNTAVEAQGSPVLGVYPNPVRGQLSVSLLGATASMATIYDTQGRVMLQTTPGSSLFTLDLSTFRAGLYLVRVHTPNGAITRSVLKAD